jgi:hypothetical protein
MDTNRWRHPDVLIYILLIPVLAGAIWTSSGLTVDVHYEKEGKTEITAK